MILLAVLALAALALGTMLARTIRGDGHGHRTPPPSHAGDGPPRPWWTDTLTHS